MIEEKEYPGHARRIMSALWGQGQMSFSKAVALVDHGVNLSSPREVLTTILNELDLESDVFITEGVLDVLDHSAPEPLFGAKIGLDATRRRTDEKERSHAGARDPGRPLPDDKAISRSIKGASRLLTSFHAPSLEVRNRVLLINFAKDAKTPGRTVSEKILSKPGLEAFSIFVLLDSAIDLHDYSLVLWKLFNNVDPARDIVRRNGRIAADATKKGPEDGHTRPWPDDIEMDPEIARRVQRRAKDLGIEGFIYWEQRGF